MIKTQQQKNNKDKFFQKYAKGTLHSHSAIAPFGSPNTVYAVHSLHFALPYFAPLRSAKHRIYRNVRQNSLRPLRFAVAQLRGHHYFTYCALTSLVSRLRTFSLPLRRATSPNKAYPKLSAQKYSLRSHF